MSDPEGPGEDVVPPASRDPFRAWKAQIGVSPGAQAYGKHHWIERKWSARMSRLEAVLISLGTETSVTGPLDAGQGGSHTNELLP